MPASIATTGGMREIPISTACAIRTGNSTAGTVFVGVWYFGDPAGIGRYLGVAPIISGAVVLKMAH